MTLILKIISPFDVKHIIMQHNEGAVTVAVAIISVHVSIFITAVFLCTGHCTFCTFYIKTRLKVPYYLWIFINNVFYLYSIPFQIAPPSPKKIKYDNQKNINFNLWNVFKYKEFILHTISPGVQISTIHLGQNTVTFCLITFCSNILTSDTCGRNYFSFKQIL